MNLNDLGSFATYLKGPYILSISWVPIEAYLRALQKVACNFSWALINAL